MHGLAEMPSLLDELGHQPTDTVEHEDPDRKEWDTSVTAMLWLWSLNWRSAW